MYGNKGAQLYQYFGLLLFHIFEAILKVPLLKRACANGRIIFFCLI